MNDVTIIDRADTGAIAAWLSERLDTTGAITIPGGSTPFPILAALIEGRGIDWTRWEVWPNDDRIVPEHHEASNTGKIRALLEPAGAKIVALGEDLIPPRFALAWLGMGADGHIASLFPNTEPEVDDQLPIRRLTPDPLPANAPFDRITLTLPSLLDSDEIVFTLGGSAEKLAVFEAALRGEHDLPVARLLRARRANQPLTVFT